MPIVMSKDEWARIERWTQSDREDPEMLRRREYVQYLDKTSKEMTKSWPNSVENVNKRNEELRLARIEAAEQANTKFYKKYVKRKQEEQERLMYSARDTVFKNKDAPKLLLTAVIETVIQKERAEQVKFNEEQRRKAAEMKRQEDDEILRKAKEWNDMHKVRKQRRFEANKKHQQEIVEQANEISERNRKEYEMELNLQKLDNLQANKQMEDLKEFEDNFKQAERARIFADMEQSKKENEQRRQENEARDKMDDRLLDVMLKSRARIEKQRKETELNIKKEKMRVLEAISNKLESGDAKRDAKEQANLEKAIKEKDDLDEATRQAKERKLAEFRRQKQESRKQFLRDEAQRLHEFNTMRQWEIMNRFKNAELYDDFKEDLNEKKKRKIQEYRAEILRLWREREEREKRERAETRYFYGELAMKKLRDADNKLLTHAAHLLQEAKEHGRPDHALHKAVDRYCKLYRLYPMPDLPTSLKEHFSRYAPWDGSKPDAHYKEPPPPPPEVIESLDLFGEEPVVEQHANGLQEPPKPETAKKVEKAKEEQPKVEKTDYKRVGKANGLQQRRDGEVCLPPITVIPCQTPACTCILKK